MLCVRAYVHARDTILFAVTGSRFALELELYWTPNDAAVTSGAAGAADVSHQDTLFHSK